MPLTQEKGSVYLLVCNLVSILAFLSMNTLFMSTYVLSSLNFLCKSIFFVHLFVVRLQVGETHIVFRENTVG